MGAGGVGGGGRKWPLLMSTKNTIFFCGSPYSVSGEEHSLVGDIWDIIPNVWENLSETGLRGICSSLEKKCFKQ